MAYPDAVIIPHIAPDLPNDHRHGIGAEFYIQCTVEIIDGLDQTDTADLKKVVHVFIAGVKAFDYA